MGDVFSDSLIENVADEDDANTPPTVMAKKKKKIHGFMPETKD